MNQKKGVLFTILAACAFGLGSSLSPLTYGEGGCSPVMLALLRFVVCLPILIVFSLCTKVPLRLERRQLLPLFLLGAIGTGATTLLLNSAFSMLDAGIADTLHFTYPIFVLLGSVLFYKAKITKVKVLAMGISLAGIVCFMFSGSGESTVSSVGIVVAIISGICYAFYLLFMDKSGMAEVNPFKTSIYITLFAMVVLALYALITNQLVVSTITPQSWLVIVISGVLSLAGMILIQLGIQNTDSTMASILSTFEPVTCTISGILLLGESLTVMKFIGCVLVLAGVVVLTTYKEKQPEPQGEAQQ